MADRTSPLQDLTNLVKSLELPITEFTEVQALRNRVLLALIALGLSTGSSSAGTIQNFINFADGDNLQPDYIEPIFNSNPSSIINTIIQAIQGLLPVEVDEPELPLIIPGHDGAIGPAGQSGLAGLDGLDGEDSFIPGPVGPVGPSGTGTVAVTKITQNLTYASKTQSITITDALIVPTSKIMISLGTGLDTDTNSDDMIDIIALSTVPQTGSFLARMNFLTPIGGPFTLNYIIG
jgi:hypothetical protein